MFKFDSYYIYGIMSVRCTNYVYHFFFVRIARKLKFTRIRLRMEKISVNKRM